MSTSFEGEPSKTLICIKDTLWEGVSNAPEKITRFFRKIIAYITSPQLPEKGTGRFTSKKSPFSLNNNLDEHVDPPFYVDPEYSKEAYELKIKSLFPSTQLSQIS